MNPKFLSRNQSCSKRGRSLLRSITRSLGFFIVDGRSSRLVDDRFKQSLRGRRNAAVCRVINTVPWGMWVVPTLIGALLK